MSQINSVVQSANKIVVLYNNQPVGLCQDINFSDDYNPEPASGVGNIYVQEWVPTMARYEIHTRFMVLNQQSMYSAGIAFVDGNAALTGLVFDIQIIDGVTGGSLRKYTGCSYASGNVRVEKHNIVVSEARFVCLQPTGTMVG